MALTDDRVDSSGLQARLDIVRGAFRLDAAVDAPRGEVTAIVGPNGSGKSTILRAVAGLASLQSGFIRLDGQVLDDGRKVFVAPEQRPIGMVFQDYLLFPHLSVQDNVAFGIRARGASTRAARDRAAHLLEEFGIADLARRRPEQISGGQAQRVAVIRALATAPAALLLDEPLAALDARTRADLRGDLSRRLREFPGVTLLVTHEPLEALVLADRIIVVEDGRVIQAGPVAQVAARPASAYVATMMGVNLLRGVASGDRIALDGGGELVTSGAPTGAVFATIRPSAVTVHRHRPEGSARNVWQARVGAIEEAGDRIRVAFEGQPSLLVDLTPASVAQLSLTPGAQAWLSVKATEIAVYPGAVDIPSTTVG